VPSITGNHFCLSMSFKVIYFDGEIFHLFAVHLLSKL
jgi:hypothetical protein